MLPVTVAIPTCNRGKLLEVAIESVLRQTVKHLEVLILDNDSNDNTEQIAKSFNDRRINYVKNKSNIGMINNWNKGIELAKGEYILILGDDDKLHTNFLEESLQIHREYPGLGFTFTHSNKVDENGKYLMRWGYNFPPIGYMDGIDYLFWTIKYGSCLTNSSTVLINRNVYKKIGSYKRVYAANTFDFNMWIRIAMNFDVFFIDKVLVDYRVHPRQVSEIHWRRPNRPTGKIGTYLELFEAIAWLLKDPKCQDKDKREFLLKRLVEINHELTQLLLTVIPDL